MRGYDADGRPLNPFSNTPVGAGAPPPLTRGPPPQYGTAQPAPGPAGFGMARGPPPPAPEHGDRRSLFVGNLSPFTSEGLLYHVFATVGPVSACRIIKDKNGESQRYGFVDFLDSPTAEHALQVLNGRVVFGCALNCNWAAGTLTAAGAPGGPFAPPGAVPATAAGGATGESFQLFVGNLSSEVDDQLLYRAFAPFKSICEARVVKDNEGLSRCYGFVSFRTQADADQAMMQMNGEYLGKRAIRVNNAKSKEADDAASGSSGGSAPQQVDPSNVTVYVGGLPAEATDWDLRMMFEDVGTVTEVRMHDDKAFAFVVFRSHDEASKAVAEKHNLQVGNRRIKVQWSKGTV